MPLDGKLFSVWDVVNTLNIEHIVTALRQLAFGASAFAGNNERLDVAAIIPVCDALQKCMAPFSKMGFTTSAGMIYKFLDAAKRNMAHGDWTATMFAEKCHAVFSTIQCETMGVVCFKFDSRNTEYFDKKTPFGPYVAAGLA